MVAKTIIIIATVFGLIYSIGRKETFSIVITAGLAVGVGIALFTGVIYRPLGFYIYMLFNLLAIIYALVKDGMELRQRIFLILISAFVITYWLFAINHWHGNIWLFMIFPIVFFIWWLVCKVKIRNELGFVIIMVADALAVIYEYWVGRF